jgi:hypothetical protein
MNDNSPEVITNEPENYTGKVVEIDYTKEPINVNTFDTENKLDEEITNSMYDKIEYYKMAGIQVEKEDLYKFKYECVVEIITDTQEKITITFNELVKNPLDLNNAIEIALQKAGIDSKDTFKTLEKIRVIAMPLPDDAGDQPLPDDSDHQPLRDDAAEGDQNGGRKTRKTRKNKTKRKRNNKQRKSKKHKKQSKRC